MAKAKRPRLKKAPVDRDYVVQHVTYAASGRTEWIAYKTSRTAAREDARTSNADRVRVFRIKYELVSDKRKSGK